MTTIASPVRLQRTLFIRITASIRRPYQRLETHSPNTIPCHDQCEEAKVYNYKSPRRGRIIICVWEKHKGYFISGWEFLIRNGTKWRFCAARELQRHIWVSPNYNKLSSICDWTWAHDIFLNLKNWRHRTKDSSVTADDKPDKQINAKNTFDIDERLRHYYRP